MSLGFNLAPGGAQGKAVFFGKHGFLGNRQRTATTSTAALNDVATAGGGHAGHEAVFLDAFDFFWLPGSFRHAAILSQLPRMGKCSKR